MIGFDEVLRQCRVERVDLVAWIEREWVLPARADGDYVFSETDLARIELICDLRRDLELDDEALSVILPLLDQVYGLRASLRRIGEAIGALPEPARLQLRDELRKAARRQRR
jgi:chaperone modulatory protein CbpM